MKQVYLFVSLLFSLFTSSSFSQECDIIVLKTGEEIASQVLEIRLSEIAYKKCDFTSGPTYVLSKTEVFMIKYKNGQKDLLGEQSSQNTFNQQAEKQYIGNVFSEKKADKSDYWEITCFKLFMIDGSQLNVKIFHYSLKQCIFKPCDDSFVRTVIPTRELNYIEDDNHTRFYFNIP
jgi:hypothetical protein